MKNSLAGAFVFSLTVSLLAMSSAPLAAQIQTEVPAVVPSAKPITVDHIQIHGTALEGNLEGDAVDRDAFVFLPPSYQKEKHRRYPVVYALHGYSIGAEQWTHEIHVPQTIEGAFAQGAREMIVVLPDSKTIHNGSMYSSSVTTGDFENYIAHDVVAYIDAHYRTIPERSSRGLVGHSMGGYGATRIGMKHSDVFGSLYIMSPCCLAPRPPGPPNPELEKTLEAVKTPEDSAKLPFFAAPALPLRPWLHAELRQLADELALPAVASIAVALMEQTRPGGVGARPPRHVTVITERLAAAFALAVDAGELDTAPDAALAAAHLIGPLVYRTTLQAAAVPDQLLTDVIEAVADWRQPDGRVGPAGAS